MAGLLLFAASLPLAAREKDKHTYGEGLIVNIPMPERQVAQVVEDVAQNGIIRGTKEYIKDEYVSGAKAAVSSPAFAAWNEGGKVFYKVREHALDPYNFRFLCLNTATRCIPLTAPSKAASTKTSAIIWTRLSRWRGRM